MRGTHHAVAPTRLVASPVALIGGAGAVVIVLVVTLHGVFGSSDDFPVPSKATLAGLSMRLAVYGTPMPVTATPRSLAT